jgi:hypothetical protein
MNPYVNEEVAWQRLKDLQREVESSRLLATNGVPAATRLLRSLAGWARQRVPNRRQVVVEVPCCESDAAADVA